MKIGTQLVMKKLFQGMACTVAHVNGEQFRIDINPTGVRPMELYFHEDEADEYFDPFWSNHATFTADWLVFKNDHSKKVCIEKHQDKHLWVFNNQAGYAETIDEAKAVIENMENLGAENVR